MTTRATDNDGQSPFGPGEWTVEVGGYGSLGQLRSALEEATRAALLNAVAARRRAGMSWAQIGAELGTSRQNVHKRWGNPR